MLPNALLMVVVVNTVVFDSKIMKCSLVLIGLMWLYYVLFVALVVVIVFACCYGSLSWLDVANVVVAFYVISGSALLYVDLYSKLFHVEASHSS